MIPMGQDCTMQVRRLPIRNGSCGIAVALTALWLSACGDRGKEPDLLAFPRSAGPDEFTILPNRPLEPPDDYSTLPVPAPGESNRTTFNPTADAITALGGSPEAAARGSTDRTLISHAGRFGTDRDIRQTLVAEDLEFRRRNNGRLLERIFNVNVYFRSYEDQTLDRYRELSRLRGLGIRTPAAPPDPTIQESR